MSARKKQECPYFCAGQVWVHGNYRIKIVEVIGDTITWDGIYDTGYFSSRRDFERAFQEYPWVLLEQPARVAETAPSIEELLRQ